MTASPLPKGWDDLQRPYGHDPTSRQGTVWSATAGLACATCPGLALHAIPRREDDPGHRSVLGEALVDAGYGVALVPNGLAALDFVRGAAPDLVILDLDLPILDVRNS